MKRSMVSFARLIRDAFFVVAAFACLVVIARAEIVLSNLNVSDVDLYEIKPSVWMAQRFVTNSQSWTLTSAKLAFVAAINTSGNLYVGLYGNGTGHVAGGLLAALTGSSNPATAGQCTYTSTGIDICHGPRRSGLRRLSREAAEQASLSSPRGFGLTPLACIPSFALLFPLGFFGRMKLYRSARHSASLALLFVILATVAFAPAKAAPLPIVWGAPQTIGGDSDVDTTGSLVYAFTFGGTASAPPSATVNGVTFTPFTIPGGIVTSATVGNVTISESPGRLLAFNTFGSGSAPFSGLSSSYQSLLGTGAYADSPLTITISLNGLTSGQQYRLQWWTNDSAKRTGAFGGMFSNTTATSGTSSVTLDANTTDVVGGVGQFAIGTFTAAGTTQAFTLTEPSFGQNPLINALQVRAVPEPSTYAMVLAGLACGGLSMWRSRKRASGGHFVLGKIGDGSESCLRLPKISPFPDCPTVVRQSVGRP